MTGSRGLFGRRGRRWVAIAAALAAFAAAFFDRSEREFFDAPARSAN